MKLLEKFNRIFGAGGEGPDPLFYTKLQTYEVRYEVVVKNMADDKNSFYVILPIPPDTPYQKILQGPYFSKGSPSIPRPMAGMAVPKPSGRDGGSTSLATEGLATSSGTNGQEVSLGQDPVFGNRYAYWQAELAPNESKVFREEFTITVSPRKAIIDESLTLDDYNLMSYDLVRFQNAYIDGEDERVKRIIQEVVGEERRVSEIIRRLNEYVISHLVYGNPIKRLYSSKDALRRDKVDCGGFDTLLAALCIAAGIPARIVSGFWAGYDKNGMHAWLEIMLSNRGSIPVDPSMEHLRKQGRTKKSGELGFIGSDRIAMSVGCEIPLTVGGKSFCVDILQNPIVFAEKGDSFTMETRFITRKEI